MFTAAVDGEVGYDLREVNIGKMKESECPDIRLVSR